VKQSPASFPRNGFAVVASHAGIQYSSALMFNRNSGGILDARSSRATCVWTLVNARM
jgi:hypothetical protein